ncbi:MAG: PTS sugar transporter subunit IIA [Longimicrobiales bacterium]
MQYSSTFSGTMKITDILSPTAVTVPLRSTEKKAVIDELVDVLDGAGLIEDPETLKRVVWDREQQRSTGIGDGLAIPHGKSSCAKDLVIAVGRPATPIDFDAVDGQPVQLVVLLASPPDRTAEHIQALGRISRMLSKREVRQAAYAAESAEDLYRLFKDADS